MNFFMLHSNPFAVQEFCFLQLWNMKIDSMAAAAFGKHWCDFSDGFEMGRLAVATFHEAGISINYFSDPEPALTYAGLNLNRFR